MSRLKVALKWVGRRRLREREQQSAALRREGEVLRLVDVWVEGGQSELALHCLGVAAELSLAREETRRPRL